MKKVSTLIALALIALSVHAQRSIDLGLGVYGPLQIYSDSVTGTTPIALQFECLQYGPDKVYKGDTVLYNVILADRFNETIEAEFPKGVSTVGASYIFVADRTYSAGDSMHLRDKLTLNKVTTHSREMLLGGSCVIRKSQGDTVVDPKLRNNTWFRFCRWYNAKEERVSVSAVEAPIAKIYPTVVSEELYIELEEDQTTVDVSVVNALGKTVSAHPTKMAKGQWVLPVSEFANGLYFVTLVGDNGTSSTRRIWVQH